MMISILLSQQSLSLETSVVVGLGMMRGCTKLQGNRKLVFEMESALDHRDWCSRNGWHGKINFAVSALAND